MKTYETKDRPVRVLKDITCDHCGQIFYEEGEIYGPCGASFSFDTGYPWKLLPDMTRYEFDLCEECIKKLILDACPPGTIRIKELSFDD